MTDEAADECAGGGRELRDDALVHQTPNSTITPTGAAATRAFVAFVNVHGALAVPEEGSERSLEPHPTCETDLSVIHTQLAAMAADTRPQTYPLTLFVAHD